MGDVGPYRVPEQHRAEARQLTERLRASGWASHVTVEALVRGWEQLAREVADFPWTIDDYTNDMTGRDAIEQVLQWASPPLRRVLWQRVEAADVRFRAATVEDGGVAVGRYFRLTDRDGWWWLRRPARGRLGAYLDDTR